MTEIYGPLPSGMTRATDFSASEYENQAVSLVDLVRARMAVGQSVLRNAVFTNCRIEGPGVVLVIDCKIADCDFGDPDGDTRNLVLRPASQRSVVGALPVNRCIFVGCHFVGLGWTGPDSFLDQIIAIGVAQ